MSVISGVSEGTWIVFAEKAMAERDAAIEGTGKMRDALRAAEKRELEALAELDEAIAEIERLRWGNEMACENTPVSSCDCSGCMVARDRAERNVTGPEGKRCACQLEAGDSPCPMHGEHDE